MKNIIILIVISAFGVLFSPACFGQFPNTQREMLECEKNCPSKYIEKEGDTYIQTCSKRLEPIKKSLRKTGKGNTGIQSLTPDNTLSCKKINIGEEIIKSGTYIVTNTGLYKDEFQISLKMTLLDSNLLHTLNIIGSILLGFLCRRKIGLRKFYKEKKRVGYSNIETKQKTQMIGGFFIGLLVLILSFFLGQIVIIAINQYYNSNSIQEMNLLG